MAGQIVLDLVTMTLMLPSQDKGTESIQDLGIDNLMGRDKAIYSSTTVRDFIFLLLIILTCTLSFAGDLKGRIDINADGIVIALAGGNEKFFAADSQAVLNQIDMEFIPLILPVIKGTTVDFPNNELAIYHNVFSISDPKRFNLHTYRPGKSKSITFENSGIIEVFCAIHTRMYAVIPVLTTPYFTTVDDNSFKIDDIPAGDYTLIAIIVNLRKQEFRQIEQKVTIPPEGVINVNLLE